MRICAALLVLLSASPGFSFLIPWGDGVQQLGLRNVPEQERAGPVTFSLSPAGTILIADTLHSAVKEFSPDGQYVRTIVSDVRPSSMGYDSKGNLLLLEDHTIKVLEPSGHTIRSITVPAGVPLVEGYGQEVFAEGDNVGVNDPDEVVYFFAANSGDTPTTASRVEHGREVRSGQRAFTRMASATTAELLDQPASDRALGRALSPPKPNISVSSNRQLGAVIYRGASSTGDLFVEVEELDSAGQVHLNVHQVAGSIKGKSAGISMGQIELPNDYFTTIYKKFEVRPDGVILQMRTKPEGVEFTTGKVQP